MLIKRHEHLHPYVRNFANQDVFFYQDCNLNIF